MGYGKLAEASMGAATAEPSGRSWLPAACFCLPATGHRGIVMCPPLVQLPQFAAEFFRRFPGGRRRLLALTYRFNAAAFEHNFARVLSKNIQADIIGGEALIPRGNRCRLWRAKWPGTFHPKLLMLLSDNRVAVGLGSANMTPEGICENLETWGFFEHRKEDAPVMSGVRRFLERLDATGAIDPAVGISEFVSSLPAAGNACSVLSTLEGTLLSQASAHLSGPVARLDVVSPISADPSELVGSLKHQFSIREIRLFTNRPVSAIKGVDQYCELRESPSSERRLGQAHSKMFAFHKGQNVDLLWGSANLSCAAWLCTGKNASVELLVHSRISSGHWQGMLQIPPRTPQVVRGAVPAHPSFVPMSGSRRAGACCTVNLRMANCI